MATTKRNRLSPFHVTPDICDTNSGQGWIPEEQPFISGHPAPRYHQGCKCRLEVRREPEPEDIPKM